MKHYNTTQNVCLFLWLTSPIVAPFALLRKETRLSAGCETIAHSTPAIYPAAKLTPSCIVLLHCSFGVGMAYLYIFSTIVSKEANFIIVSDTTQKCKRYSLFIGRMQRWNFASHTSLMCMFKQDTKNTNMIKNNKVINYSCDI